MKRVIWVFALVAVLLTGPQSFVLAAAQETGQDSLFLQRMDSIEIGLITCEPHDEVYSLYGHSALRYHDLSTGYDRTFNWGVFNYNAPFFVLRFVFGITDYMLEAIPTGLFCKYYADWGSGVSEQVLNLTREEKARITVALGNNLQPENLVYRYNFFYDNCSTRPRDIIEQVAFVEYNSKGQKETTFRKLLHEMLTEHPWAAFGNDLLLGCKADMPIDGRLSQFLPHILAEAFEKASIPATDGTTAKKRKLVGEVREIVPSAQKKPAKEFPLSPMQCAVLLLIASLAVMAYEWRKGKTMRWWDTILMLMQGITGVVITIMLFSQHPATSTNLQILLLNPLPLIYINKVWRGRKTVYWKMLVIMTVLFMAGGLIQDYAEGMYFVALSLLTRPVTRLIRR